MAISNKMSILGTKKAVMAYNGGYYLPSVSDEGILSWSPTVEGMAPIPEVNVRGPQGSDASVTAEAVQAVVPMAWGVGSTTVAPTAKSGGIAIGYNSSTLVHGVAIGENTYASSGDTVVGQGARGNTWSCAFGYGAKPDTYSFAAGIWAEAKGHNTIGIGYNVHGKKSTSVTIGSRFEETTDSGNVTHTCTTEGTGSITIGAGANTLNYTATDGTIAESSNAITIGCKAENHNPDSIVIGASAKLNAPEAYGSRSGSIVIGAEAQSQGVNGIAIGRRANTYNAIDGIAIGTGARANANCVALGSATDAGMGSLAAGYYVKASAYTCVAVGSQAEAKAQTSSAFGVKANAADEGVCVFSSYMQNGNKTQLYFSGANTPLANQYYNGEAMMGYVVTDSTGTKLACGTRRLSELFTDNTLAQPASLDENGEWVMPKVFHPSDLDLPQEEPRDPEEYQPLPVYPIVEPEIPEVEEV